jgi:hypothetical protein
MYLKGKRQSNGIFIPGPDSDEVGGWSRSNQHQSTNQHQGIGGTGAGRKQISWRQNMKQAG